MNKISSAPAAPSRVNRILGRNPFPISPRNVLQRVVLRFGDVLQTRRITYVYFPIDCVVSLITSVEGHLPVECAVIGSEGMVGVSVALGVVTSSANAIVQGAGTALRMHAPTFQQELKTDPALQKRLHRYIDQLLAQITQTAACQAFHTVQARCARWLLMRRDRTQSDHLEITQAFLAQMLGVRRVGVTVAARDLQRRGIISYSRGRVVILDPERLAADACACYHPEPPQHRDQDR